MNVKIIKTGKTETFGVSYGMRLIEQGLAILASNPVRKADKKPDKMDRKETAKAGDA